MTNNFPVTFSFLTMDGGVQQGNTSYHFFPASILDGEWLGRDSLCLSYHG